MIPNVIREEALSILLDMTLDSPEECALLANDNLHWIFYSFIES